MTISVIIVSWNTRELLLAAVESVLVQEVEAELELIVVDNGSTDGTVDALREHFPGLTVLVPETNLGFAGGNNLGLEQATGEYTLLLNPDTIVRPGALATLLRCAEEQPAVGAWQPMLILPNGKVQVTWEYVPSLWAEFWLVAFRSKYVYTPSFQARVKAWDEPRDVPAVGLAALFVPARVWERVGRLSTETFLYFEESDLSERLRGAGLPMKLVPAARIEHHIGQSTGQVPYVRKRAHYLSRLWFYETHRCGCQARVIRWLSRLRAWLGIVQAKRRVRLGEASARQAIDELWAPVLNATKGG